MNYLDFIYQTSYNLLATYRYVANYIISNAPKNYYKPALLYAIEWVSLPLTLQPSATLQF